LQQNTNTAWPPNVWLLVGVRGVAVYEANSFVLLLMSFIDVLLFLLLLLSFPPFLRRILLFYLPFFGFAFVVLAVFIFWYP
jgi:hypothetical protein